MDRDYEIVDSENGIIREIKERKYHYPRTRFTKTLAESIYDLTFEVAKAIQKAIEEYTDMKLKEYMEHKKELENGSKNKRRVNKRVTHRKSQPRKHSKKDS